MSKSEKTVKDIERRERGNTSKPSLGNKEVKNRAFSWTLNNYTEEIFEKTQKTLGSLKCLYVIGKEIGESGTPHLQGYSYFTSTKSFRQVKLLISDKIHIEKSKGSKEQNFNYCTKDGDYVTNMDYKVKRKPKPLKEPLKGKVLRPFQKEILDLCDAVVNDKYDDERSIHWFYENEGNVGKSSLCKHILMHYDAVIVNGKANDIFNGVVNFKEVNGVYPEIVILDIPRSCIDYVNYPAIESLKNGCFYSGKYVGATVIMNSPLVVCLANEGPKSDEMSKDRWKIKRLSCKDVIVKHEGQKTILIQ